MHTGYYPTITRFNFYLENDIICIDGKGEASGQVYQEDRSWDHPGCEDYEIDIESLEIEGWASHAEHHFENYDKVTMYGQEAYDFLCENGWDEDEIEWEIDDD
tara:strand:- start:56 stop:364 length:309 start_codon:yes stop_codon:yes gene_type:complete